MSIYIHVTMGTRTVALSDEVYEKLRSLKRTDESFSELLDRLTGRPSLMELVGALPRGSVAKVRAAVEEGRVRSRARRSRMAP